VSPRRFSLRVSVAVLHAAVFAVAGLVFIVVNFGLVESSASEDNDSGLVDAVIGIGALTAVALAAGWFIAGQALRPLRAVTATAQRISATTLDQRIALGGPDDELKELADTIDALLARLEASFGRERRFVANASHELRTPLAVTRTALELGLAQPNPTADDLRDVMRQALRATGRSEALSNELLLLARSENLAGEPREHFDLGELVGEVVDHLIGAAAEAGVALRSDRQPAPVFGIPGLIDRLVVNLVDNAIRHNVEHGWVHVTTRVSNGTAIVDVRNTCLPVQQVAVDELFEPFRRGPGGSGSTPAGHGLGLSIVRAIADGHGADVRAAYVEGGTEFEIRVEFRG
jgi:signal transduction histidine kinase